MALVTIDKAGWIHAPFVQHIVGVPDKVYSQSNAATGMALHSIVGQESEFADGVPNRFLSEEKDSQGRYTPNAAASVQSVLRKFATIVPGYATWIQMYSLYGSTWTSGGREGNTTFMSIELEGGGAGNHGEPMNAAQVKSFVAVMRAIEDWRGIKFEYGKNMLQHKDIAQKFGYAPTACASNRYDLGIKALAESTVPGREEGVMQAQIDELAKGFQQVKAQGDRLNDVLVARFTLQSIAMSSDPSRVIAARDILQREGFI